MMELKSNDSFFRLTVLDYKYPDALEPYDADWLLIQVDARSPEDEWTGTDPCLLTFEAVRLANWLDALATGKAANPALSFLEPVLLFRVVEKAGGEKFLRVHFGNLIHPSWVADSVVGQDLSLDFPLADAAMLSAAARELRQELKRYPQRGGQY